MGFDTTGEFLEDGTEIVELYAKCDDEPELYDRYRAELHKLAPQYTWTVRMPSTGEAPGIYYRRTDGTLQIMGFTAPVPSDITDTVCKAWAAIV